MLAARQGVLGANSGDLGCWVLGGRIGVGGAGWWIRVGEWMAELSSCLLQYSQLMSERVAVGGNPWVLWSQVPSQDSREVAFRDRA